ncbi:type II toxin-antitoxin system HipA family toxin [Thiomicrorhabdus hydrogeniphila]
MTKRLEQVAALRISLHDKFIGVLAHYQAGKNIFTFSPEYKSLPSFMVPTITLRQKFDKDYLETPLIHRQKIPPILSNLLPEGALREWMTQILKTHTDNEFSLLAYAGKNLSGAIVATPIAKEEIPSWALIERENTEAVPINISALVGNKFSLAGVQMKFSSRHQDGRFLISDESSNDTWIIKTPSTNHKHVPENEYSSMLLAKSVGIDIPDIKLVELDKLDNLPDIRLPNEEFAYAIKRFDRNENKSGLVTRIHTEDFAQIFDLYPINKYNKINYEQIGLVLHLYSNKSLFDVQQFARRLLVNILLGNGDAHIKNWSVIYNDQQTPELSPAYDILSTMVYIQEEVELALNMAKNKNWYEMSYRHFEIWSKKIEVHWPAIKVHLDDTMELARTVWPEQLNNLPMHDEHKKRLKNHWLKLHKDFKIEA